MDIIVRKCSCVFSSSWRLPKMSSKNNMSKAWETRRRKQTAEAQWFQSPTCCCGCGAKLPKKGGPKTQSKFKQGHDAKLHSLVRKGEPLPEVAEAMRAHIPFLQKHQGPEN